MLRDITLGQYYPADSVIHKLDPRVKPVSYTHLDVYKRQLDRRARADAPGLSIYFFLKHGDDGVLSGGFQCSRGDEKTVKCVGIPGV